MLESYISKVLLTFVGAGCGIVGIAGGYYTTYLIVTFVGA
jgi:hypothetical protein